MMGYTFVLIGIGAGSGGLACAQRAAEYGARSSVEPALMLAAAKESDMKCSEGCHFRTQTAPQKK